MILKMIQTGNYFGLEKDIISTWNEEKKKTIANAYGRSTKLAFLDINNFPRLGSCKKQICLSFKKTTKSMHIKLPPQKS